MTPSSFLPCLRSQHPETACYFGKTKVEYGKYALIVLTEELTSLHFSHSIIMTPHLSHGTFILTSFSSLYLWALGILGILGNSTEKA